MYLYIPIGIFLGALIAIAWIISRKFVYLKKLTPESLDSSGNGGSGFWEEMYPEIAQWLKQVNLRQYGVDFLNDFEKMLRKLRLISLKIDTLTGKLIHRVRKSSKNQEAILVQEAAREEEKAAETDITELNGFGGTPEELKQKEQLLIIEIAKNPKDAQLYKELGTIYMRTGEWEDAKQSFEKAVEYDPLDDNVKRKLGRVMAKISDKKE